MGIGLAEATPGLSCSNCSLGWWHHSGRTLRTGPGLTEQDFSPSLPGPSYGSVSLPWLILSLFLISTATPPPSTTTHS